jgi:hypothetical protein
MKLKALSVITTLAGLALGGCNSAGGSSGSLSIVPVYDSIPTPLPPNLPSQSFQATKTAEFGEFIALAPGTGRHGTAATIAMSNWSLETTDLGGATPDATGFDWPITLNIYEAPANGASVPGALIKSYTQTFHVPWRPPSDQTCTDGPGRWRAGDGKCYGGIAFTITFDLSASGGITLPDSFVYGIAFNTQTAGEAPTNQAGPYTGLNVARSTSSAPSTGTNAGTPNTVYWNTGYFTNWTAMSGFMELPPQGDTEAYLPAVEFFAY